MLRRSPLSPVPIIAEVENMRTATDEDHRALVAPGTWRVDPERSNVAFAIHHFGVATVHGRFSRFSGIVERDQHGIGIRGAVITASVETGNELRDDRVRGGDFLDTIHHPEVRFASRTVEPTGAGAFRVTGDLTIVGITRPITLKATTHRDGADRVRVTARGSVRRSDFGIEPASLLEAGVGDRIALALDISARSA
jgi:polyisoprenoid-binding protein YceI